MLNFKGVLRFLRNQMKTQNYVQFCGKENTFKSNQRAVVYN